MTGRARGVVSYKEDSSDQEPSGHERVGVGVGEGEGRGEETGDDGREKIEKVLKARMGRVGGKQPHDFLSLLSTLSLTQMWATRQPCTVGMEGLPPPTQLML